MSKSKRIRRRQQPRIKGIVRGCSYSYMHTEVLKNLKDIARTEQKSLSWVVAEIVYRYFGLKIEKEVIKLQRAARKEHESNVVEFMKKAHRR